MPYPLCDDRPSRGLVVVCSFGAPVATARERFAVIGDSHAAAWKPALEVVTHVRGWHGYSIFRAGCPPTTAHAVLPDAARSRACDRWNREVRAWLARHPSVGTVFLSARASVRVSGDAYAGYARAIAALPRSVKRVVVLRDTPTTTGATIGCIRSALARRVHPGFACAQPRSVALRPDPLAAAARASRRGSVVDLSRFFCDRTRCFPAIGGALVLRDTTHVTTEFAASLGPYLARALAF